MASDQQANNASEERTSRPEEKNYFRSQRTVLINNNWYFMNRETAAEGPFKTKKEADEAVERYIELVTSPLFASKELERINALTF